VAASQHRSSGQARQRRGAETLLDLATGDAAVETGVWRCTLRFVCSGARGTHAGPTCWAGKPGGDPPCFHR
jgi:hypothetical protein